MNRHCVSMRPCHHKDFEQAVRRQVPHMTDFYLVDTTLRDWFTDAEHLEKHIPEGWTFLRLHDGNPWYIRGDNENDGCSVTLYPYKKWQVCRPWLLERAECLMWELIQGGEVGIRDQLEELKEILIHYPKIRELVVIPSSQGGDDDVDSLLESVIKSDKNLSHITHLPFVVV